MRTMYEEPAIYTDAFSYWGIDYILVSAYERSSYAVDEVSLSLVFPCVYDANGIRLYQVK